MTASIGESLQFMSTQAECLLMTLSTALREGIGDFFNLSTEYEREKPIRLCLLLTTRVIVMNNIDWDLHTESKAQPAIRSIRHSRAGRN